MGGLAKKRPAWQPVVGRMYPPFYPSSLKVEHLAAAVQPSLSCPTVKGARVRVSCVEAPAAFQGMPGISGNMEAES